MYEQFEKLFALLSQTEKLFRDGTLPRQRCRKLPDDSTQGGDLSCHVIPGHPDSPTASTLSNNLSLQVMEAKKDCLRGNTDKRLRRLIIEASKAALHLLRMPRDAAAETILKGIETLADAKEMLAWSWEKPCSILHEPRVAEPRMQISDGKVFLDNKRTLWSLQHSDGTAAVAVAPCSNSPPQTVADISQRCEARRRSLCDPESSTDEFSRESAALFGIPDLIELWAAMRRLGGIVPHTPECLAWDEVTLRERKVALLRGNPLRPPIYQEVLKALDDVVAWCAQAGKRVILYLGDCRYRVGEEEPITVTLREDTVLQAFLACSPLSKSQLATQSGYDGETAVTILRALKGTDRRPAKYKGLLSESIRFPRKRGAGGYHVQIRRAD